MDLKRSEYIFLFMIMLISSLLLMYIYLIFLKDNSKIIFAIYPLLMFLTIYYGNKMQKKHRIGRVIKSVHGVIATTVIVETIVFGAYLLAFSGLRKIKAPIFTQIVALLIFIALSGFILHLHFKELRYISEENKKGRAE